MFISTLEQLGTIVFPAYSDIRVMMMPFCIDDVCGSLPAALRSWEPIVRAMSIPAGIGIGYLTIDETVVRAGETHRRPGLHVDGVGPDGRAGGWGGGGGWSKSGMTMASSHVGCRVFAQEFHGEPGPNGDCAHLADEADLRRAVTLEPGVIYLCGPLTVHEALPMAQDTVRQFCRVSFPSDAPWYEGYTKNPIGILPTGAIHERRAEYMGYRP